MTEKKKADDKPVKPGLYANIHAKQERIAQGSGEKMRKPGAKGAPTTDDFAAAEQTAAPSKSHPPSAKPAPKTKK